MAKHDINRLVQALRRADLDKANEVTTWITDHIAIECFDNRAGNHADLPRALLIMVHVDDYYPENSENWDVDVWDTHKGVLIAVPRKSAWREAYRIARLLSNCRDVDTHDGVIKLPCFVLIRAENEAEEVRHPDEQVANFSGELNTLVRHP